MSTPGTSLYINADWSALVPAGSVEAAFGIDEMTAKRLGLLSKAPAEVIAEPETFRSANEPDEEPEAKEAAKPDDKARRKPKTK